MSPFEPGQQWTVIHGDAVAEIADIKTNAAASVVVTDPVWPNAPEGMFPGVDPSELFKSVASHFPGVARRVVVHLGCMSDARFLSGIPASMSFVRVCWLKYARPSYFGTVLNSGDVAYVFGSREATDGKTLMPGELCVTDTSDLRNKTKDHPCPRPLESVAWLIKWFTSERDVVVDPFCGTGTTGVAAIRAGRRFIGIEKDAKYAAIARERLEAESRGLTLRDARLGQTSIFDLTGAP